MFGANSLIELLYKICRYVSSKFAVLPITTTDLSFYPVLLDNRLSRMFERWEKFYQNTQTVNVHANKVKKNCLASLKFLKCSCRVFSKKKSRIIVKSKTDRHTTLMTESITFTNPFPDRGQTGCTGLSGWTVYALHSFISMCIYLPPSFSLKLTAQLSPSLSLSQHPRKFFFILAVQLVNPDQHHHDMTPYSLITTQTELY